MRHFSLDRNLYLGGSVKNRSRGFLRLVLSRFNSGRNYYCLVYPGSGEGSQIEIQHSLFLKNPYFKKHPVHVIGVASTMEEAVELVVKISDEAVGAGMTGDLRGYLSKRCC